MCPWSPDALGIDARELGIETSDAAICDDARRVDALNTDALGIDDVSSGIDPHDAA
jgi:hypothetical protein